jgi:putative Holliday junction resolvase
MNALAMSAPTAALSPKQAKVVPPKQAKPVPADLQRFMAFDFGTRRTGVAVGSRLLGGAQPQATIGVAGDARFAQIALRLKEWEPQALVVGVPYHPDGAPHDNTLRAQKFGRQLQGRFGLPVFEVDERYSTTEALAGGAKDADAASACIILEQFLRSLSP